ncbi:MAG: hypothetical protein ACLQPD_18510 [Desulfomonilaceae bacterium]
MRSVFYGTVLVYLLAGLVAFATAPAVAQTTSNKSIQKTAPTIEHKGPVTNPGEIGFSGEAKVGASQQSQANGLEDKVPANVSAQPKPGEATVARVERSGNCLHVYTDPSISSHEIACLLKGERIHLTGMFSKDRRWAQLDNHGWVLFRDLKTDVKAPRAAMARSWGRSAGTGQGTPSTVRHQYRGARYCYPGYYYSYYYPGYYGGYWGSWY